MNREYYISFTDKHNNPNITAKVNALLDECVENGIEVDLGIEYYKPHEEDE